MTEWYLIVIISMQMLNGPSDQRINEFYRDTQDLCEQELLVLEEHYTTQLGKQIIDRVHMYQGTWYKHKHIISGKLVGFTIICEPRDKTPRLDKPKTIPWIW
jgi:hypothetical protein